MVSYHTNYNYNNYLGNTALIGAAAQGHLNVVTYLLANGSSVQEKANQGKNGFYWLSKLTKLNLIVFTVYVLYCKLYFYLHEYIT